VSASLPLINQIQHLVVWGQKSNLMSVPTDCPQRDERRGWMGDAALTAEEAMYNFHMSAFYTHWIDIINDDQNSDGSTTNTVPSLGDHSAGAPNWQTAYPTLLSVLQRYSGDKDVVAKHWSSLQAYIAFFDGQYKKTGLKNFMVGFGDWVPPPPQPKADGHLVSAFSYLRDLSLYAELATAKGDTQLANQVLSQLSTLKMEFNTAFYNSNKKVYGSGLQTEIAMGLWLDAVPPADKKMVLDNLVNDIIVTNKIHPTTGILGWKFMLETLTANGRSDTGLLVNLQDTYPSMGFMIKGNGNPEPATTIWELWDSHLEGPGMNSRNHIMFGSVGSWFYKALVGIQPAPANPMMGITGGYDHILLGPDTSIINAYNLSYAVGRTSTPRGPVEVRWSLTPAMTCDISSEGEQSNLYCPSGSTINAVTFVSYGNSGGDCAHGFTKGTCDSTKARAIVEKACLGKQTCSIPTSNDFFGGDPCLDVVKHLSVSVSCTNNYMPLDIQVLVPVGSTAEVNIPIVPSLQQSKDNLEISEGNPAKTLWLHGKYNTGVPGIVSAALNKAGNGITVLVLSGSYWFHTFATQ